MGSESAVQPLAFVHIGTHKTGTTAIQRFLADNETALRAAGLYLPRTGRTDPNLAAQHNVAFELAHNASFQREAGTLEELAAELQGQAPASNICLSSEAFEELTFNRGGLRRLCAGLEWLGYDPRIVVYLRPHADYLESLYAECVRAGWPLDFGSFLELALENRSFGEVTFAYSYLLRAFEDRFGADRLIVRPYPTSGHASALLRDFIAIVAPTVAFDHLAQPPRLNKRMTFDDVLEHIGVPRRTEVTDEPFEPLNLGEIARVARRFADDGRAVYRRYRLYVPPVSATRLQREVVRTLHARRHDLQAHRLRVEALRRVELDARAERLWLNRSLILR
jgi:hypothetical protein